MFYIGLTLGVVDLEMGRMIFFSIKWENITMDPTMRNYYVHEVQHNTGHVFSWRTMKFQISYSLLQMQ